MKEIAGRLIGTGRRFGIVCARFNDIITDRLLAGCREALIQHGVDEAAITAVRVPGSFEIPPVARRLAHSGEFDAVICLGCVIRGGTDHYEHVARAASNGIAAVADDAPVPVIFGVLTCDDLAQAMDRAGGKSGNKGAAAALAAIEMADLATRLSAPRPSKKG